MSGDEISYSVSHGPPAFPWGRTCSLMVVSVLAVVCAEEAYWRLCGHRPHVSDSADLKSYQASGAHQPNTVVLLGTSRTQAGFSPSVFRRHFGECNLVNLASHSNAGPAPLLTALAAHEGFDGTVICGLIAAHIFSERQDSERVSVEFSSERTWFEHVPLWWLADHLAIRCPRLNVRRIARRPRSIHPEYVRTRFDRTAEYDFRLRGEVNVVESCESWRCKYKSRQPWSTRSSFLQGADRIERAVRAIKRRGGRVVFVRYPSSGFRLDLEHEFHPREEFWDVFARRSGAECIHFLDVPEMSALRCPDDSHLDMRDAPRFTEALLDALVDRGVLARRQRTQNSFVATDI